METRICQHCGGQFDGMAGRVFSNHVRWCDKNPTRNNTGKLSEAMLRYHTGLSGEKTDFEVRCCKCDKCFVVNERVSIFPSKDKYYCSLKCANSRKFSEEIRQKISSSVLKTMEQCQSPQKPKEIRICCNCNSEFEATRKRKKYCGVECYKKAVMVTDEYRRYYADCRFRFNVWDYPDEFDLGLIREHGWYKATNRGDNLGGVSRDHRISINYGWENGVLAEVIAHPANCKLMRQSNNSSKHKKCSVDLGVLESEIRSWIKKYGVAGGTGAVSCKHGSV